MAIASSNASFRKQYVLLVVLAALRSLESCTDAPKSLDASSWKFCSENCLEFDHSKWQLVLDNALDSTTNFLRYRDVPRDELQGYLDQLCSTDLFSGQYSHDELWAVLANAYNALVINTVLQNNMKDSILKPWGHDVWKRDAGVLGGFTVTLDNVEHDLLRVLWNEARVHAVLVCGAKSCPPLRAEAYSGGKLEQQLQDQMRNWLADPEKGFRYDEEAHAVHLSKIFYWYGEDFAVLSDGLVNISGVLEYVAPYVESNVAAQLVKQPPPTVYYMDYDWSLNEQDSSEAEASSQGTMGTAVHAGSFLLSSALGLAAVLF